MSEQSQVPATTTTKAVAKPMSAIDTLRESLSKMRDQFRRALPKHVSVDKFERTVITAVQISPKLAECDRGSFWAACLKAASDGLLPDGRQAAIVSYRDKDTGVAKAQYQKMIDGRLMQVRNSGELASITANVVFEKDEFARWVDELGEHFKHVPHMKDNPGEAVGVYALARLKDGSVYFEFMTKSQVEDVRSCSRAKDSLKWKKFWSEGARVAVLNRLSKRLPSSADLDSDRSDFDEFDLETGALVAPETASVNDIAAKKEPATKSKRLKGLVAKQKTEPAPTPAAAVTEPTSDGTTQVNDDTPPDDTPTPDDYQEDRDDIM